MVDNRTEDRTAEEEAAWQAAQNGEHPDQPDREQTLADMEAAGQLAETPTESDHDDAPVEKKDRVPMQDFATKGWSDEAEAINLFGILKGYVERSGTIDVTVELTMLLDSDPDLSSRLTEVVQKIAFSGSYVGKDLGVGLTVTRVTIKADADGNGITEVIVRMPENQRMKLKNVVGMARTRGVLALTPLQLAIDLTARA